MKAHRNSNWFFDNLSPEEGHIHGIKKTLYSGKTEFQSMEIIETGSYGKCLILDGKMQSSEVDECICHEARVHPAMLTHPKPESVFIVGGGEGATLREVLRHKTVKRAVMVEIDKKGVDRGRERRPAYRYHISQFPFKLYCRQYHPLYGISGSLPLLCKHPILWPSVGVYPGIKK